MSLIGSELRRKEDAKLVTGQGQYADDLQVDAPAYAFFPRSPHAHARIVSMDVSAARASDGVLTVLTGQDLVEAGLKPIPHTIGSSQYGSDIPLTNRDGSERARTDHMPLPVDKVRFAGEAYAAVIATSLAAAKDAAELIEVEWEPLPAVTQAIRALDADAPLVWDTVPGNLGIEAEVGDKAATDDAFERAAHRVRFTSQINRVTGVHMEPRSSLAWYEQETESFVLRATAGTGVLTCREHVSRALGVPEEKLRVAAPPDVGGNFGTRNAIYPEFVLIAHAARLTGRPVKHVVERIEAFVSDFQARDLHVDAELALDAQGNILALRTVNTSNIGAHAVSYVALNKGIQLMSGVYRVPVAHSVGRAVLTNTPPTIPYRSAGRPEVMYTIERLMDLAARQCGFDRIELRRRNMVPKEDFPYNNPYGLTYDSGDYVGVLEQALALADWDGFEERRREARARGKYRGIGYSNYIEGTGGIPRERAEITVLPDEERIDLIIGTQDSGQGHRTAFAQLVAGWLGLDPEQVEVRASDTAFVKAGGGSHSGRSLRFGSIAMDIASRGVIDRGRAVVAALQGVEPEQVEFADGYFRLEGKNVVMHLFEVARAAEAGADLPEDLRGPVQAVGDKVTPGLAFPFGGAVCEIEIDPDTGEYHIPRYTSVDDVGRALNPMIIHGQTHGGIAQGVGQALQEAFVFDPETGQIQTASFMDYQMPRAADFPMFTTGISEVPSTSHPLGFRPGGEGGTTPALGVTINAIADALADLGVDHVEMPATPHRIWQAIQKARKAGGSDG